MTDLTRAVFGRIRDTATASATILAERLAAVHGLTDPRLAVELRAHLLATLIGYTDGLLPDEPNIRDPPDDVLRS